ncbi:DUF2272 domain-containing protein [Pseudoxanthomonas helianthi]|uniref:DUF2272 domain-containing protein n=1 Tax=Pseudoxanthomonas helianthi TaxID=1453541 RepID=A0A941AUP0_9GAMM|nr:DUF2272 domain-containing protein [Pseudoxanthomonas helianthi]MBP3985394.1 DUF2272 domain-containing protein [Pseudoxanthomonas helianthi]
MLRALIAGSLGWFICTIASPAHAADPCPLLRTQVAASDVATRIAAYACKENQDWFRPFIDADGRSGGLGVYEAENGLLADGTAAWRKVAQYWIESGTGGGGECGYAASSPYPSPGCRSFVIDRPWSAAFVSWVMRKAGLPGFRYSAGHIDYVRQAYRDPASSPYLVQAPLGGKPAPGDLLCYVRMDSRIFGFGQLATLLSMPDASGLAMHCDIVVAADPSMTWLVGGNVQNTVTLRALKLDARGYLSGLPMRTLADPVCSPNAPANCNANRQDWAVLLKLKPPAELARLPQPPRPIGAPTPLAPTHCAAVAGGMQVCSSGASAPQPVPADETR